MNFAQNFRCPLSQSFVLRSRALRVCDNQQIHITTKLINPNHDQRHKYYHLTTTLHLTLKMTTAQVVETSVTSNSLPKDYITSHQQQSF